ncbi:hypothetical protein GDO78_017505 [Eleutherodactylus coqui]|uniref:Uncharacterized protein n=1 Tax=Eleutherodactylus coqui TaxID=57060 RepID=A0A8J6BJL7_ELECQ|nr:hypothetical protein GDO78_017505 [Eleutherodactylus coqui]
MAGADCEQRYIQRGVIPPGQNPSIRTARAINTANGNSSTAPAADSCINRRAATSMASPVTSRAASKPLLGGRAIARPTSV